MSYSLSLLRSFVVWLYGRLLQLYPPRFRREFVVEIRDIFWDVILEAEGRGGFSLLKTALRELTGLVVSLLRESWHQLRSHKGKDMASEDLSDQDNRDAGFSGGALQPVRAPDLAWIAGWTVLTTAAFPAALVAMAPLAVAFMWLLNLGVKAGFWPAIRNSPVEPLGFITAMTLALASVQWYLLRRWLPRAWLWFVATGGGVLIGGLAAGLFLGRSFAQSLEPYWIMAVTLLSVGLALGVAQFIYLRRFLPNAYWIILIDVLAAGSILLAGDTFTSLAELAVLAFPGAITGVGLWFLLSQSHPELPPQVRSETSQELRRRFPRFVRVGLGLAVMVPLFFGCIWAYAASQLMLAKNEGIYASPEEAVIERNSQGWGGAEVVRIENVWAEPNSKNAQPHVWFGGAEVYLDRVPQGERWDHYSSGSFYIRVREGWVHVSEGAFPEFIGWVMELYNMEGVRW